MTSSSEDKPINVAYSCDSDDAFMWWALEKGKVDCGKYDFAFYRGDIQELNEIAMQGEYEVTAISAAAYAFVTHYYQLLDVGTSVASTTGPLVVSDIPYEWKELHDKRIAVPGLNTTAYMALRRILPDFEAKPMHFLAVAQAVLDDKADAGVVIHELQLTYAELGFRVLLDIGAKWRELYNLPLPLGVNVIAKRLAWQERQEIAAIMRASIKYGLEHRQEALQAATKKTETPLSRELGDVYIKRYVNEHTLQINSEIKRALEFLWQGTPVLEMEKIASKIEAGGILAREEALYLYEQAELPDVMRLADACNNKRNLSSAVYFNVNRHINPTNICVLSCKFCSFSRKPGEEGAFALSHEEIQQRAQQALAQGATEVHLVGGLHPRWSYEDMVGVVAAVKQAAPALHIKAYTAVEIEWMARRGRKSIEQVLRDLQEAGLGSLPGGGAEIFHPEVRDKICDTKVDAETWLHVHRTAHRLGLRSNATMLYGHIESYAHRVDHMLRLRALQEETGGFNVFIPLAFQPHGNEMGIDKYTCGADDLKTIAIARILLHNFPNIKAYWVMLGADIAQLALHAGANDIDGTVEDEKISHMAGGRAGKSLAEEQLVNTIEAADKTAVERDSLYNTLRVVTPLPWQLLQKEKSYLEKIARTSLLELGEQLQQDELLRDELALLAQDDGKGQLIKAENFLKIAPRLRLIEQLVIWVGDTQLKHIRVLATEHTTAVEWLRACALCRLLMGAEAEVIAVPAPATRDSAALAKLHIPLRLWGASALVSVDHSEER